MKKWFTGVSALACLSLALCGCGTEIDEQAVSDALELIGEIAIEELTSEEIAEEDLSVADIEEELFEEDFTEENLSEEDLLEEDLSEEDTSYEDYIPDEMEEEPAIVEGGSYTTKEDVALYIYTYGELPANFITKSEARDLGWVNKEGNLQEVAPGMSIGGDRYGNYEQLLPNGKYKECDINYDGGYRGDERIVYSEDGYIYYTDDHYESFTQLYPEAS